MVVWYDLMLLNIECIHVFSVKMAIREWLLKFIFRLFYSLVFVEILHCTLCIWQLPFQWSGECRPKARIPGHTLCLSRARLLARISANVGHHLQLFLEMRPPSALYPNLLIKHKCLSYVVVVAYWWNVAGLSPWARKLLLWLVTQWWLVWNCSMFFTTCELVGLR